MRFLRTLALAAPLLSQTSALVPFAGTNRHLGKLRSSSSSHSAYDDTRIKDHPDQTLVKYIRDYFDAFTGADFPVIESLQEPEYTMTDIRTSPTRTLSFPSNLLHFPRHPPQIYTCPHRSLLPPPSTLSLQERRN